MLIKQRRVINLEKHLTSIRDNTDIFFGISNIDRFAKKLKIVGFTEQLEALEIVLPAAKFGPISRFNADGKALVQKYLPKETAYRMVEWHWKEWRGQGETEEMTDWRDVPYQRYPRKYIAPPSCELSVTKNDKGDRIIIVGPFKYVSENYEIIRHVINLFLEIFGECEVFDSNLENILHSPLKRLNWRILPPGKYPWEILEKHIQPIIERTKKGNQPIIKDRFKTINDYLPEFHAIGEGGFWGYVVFGFASKGIYVFESNYTGNATYIFDENWEELSKLSKAEIMNENLQKGRVVHLKGWHDQIAELLGK
jgi:hypothetical protein